MLESYTETVIQHGRQAPFCPEVENLFEGIDQWPLVRLALFKRFRDQRIVILRDKEGHDDLEIVRASVMNKRVGLANGIVGNGVFSGWVVKPFFSKDPQEGWMLGRPLSTNHAPAFSDKRTLLQSKLEADENSKRWFQRFLEIRRQIKGGMTDLSQVQFELRQNKEWPETELLLT